MISFGEFCILLRLKSCRSSYCENMYLLFKDMELWRDLRPNFCTTKEYGSNMPHKESKDYTINVTNSKYESHYVIYKYGYHIFIDLLNPVLIIETNINIHHSRSFCKGKQNL